MDKIASEQEGLPKPGVKKRIAAVDIARVLAALSIMYVHIQVWNLNSNATNIVGKLLCGPNLSLDTYNCVFFVFAGYFVSRNITWKKAATSAFWCFVPYLLWNVIAFAAILGVTGAMPPCSNGAESLWERLWVYTGMSGLPPLDGPLWFIRDLAVLFLLAPIIYRLSGWIFAACVFFSLYTGYAGLLDHDYAMRMVCSQYSVGYFALGCFICKLSPEMQQKILRFYSIPMIVVFFGISATYTVSVWLGKESPLPPIASNMPFITTVVSIWMFYQFARLLEEYVPVSVRLANALTPVAFLTFAAHGIVFHWLLPDSILNTNWMVLMPLALYGLLYLFFLFQKRYARPLLRIVAHYK